MAILTGLWHKLSSSLLWVCLSLFLLRGVARPVHELGSISRCRRDLCQGLGVLPWLRGLTWRMGMRLIQWRNITSKRFVLDMVRGHQLQIWSCPPLFCNFQQFNVKAATTHDPIILKEVDELLAKGAIVPSSSGAGFYCSMFVVPKHTGGPWPILNWKHFNHYIHVLSFKMPTIRHIWQLIQHGDYAFSIDLKDAYLHIPFVKHHHQPFLMICLAQCTLSAEGLLFWLATAPWVFTALTKHILFLCHCKGFHTVICLEDILVLVHSK